MVNKIREISVVEGLLAIYDLLWTRRINIFNMPKWNFSFVSVTIHPSRWPLRPTFPISFIIYIHLTAGFFLSFHRESRHRGAIRVLFVEEENVNRGNTVEYAV